jgi:lipoyl(octanoyl) transferase
VKSPDARAAMIASAPAIAVSTQPVRLRHLGLVEYEHAWRAMQEWTRLRDADSTDEIWLLEHPPVYTLGFNCRQAIARPGSNIARVHSDRGGQITYHGPGQLVVYVLADLRRRNWGVRRLVDALEQSVVSLLRELDIDSAPRPDAPGVYVDDAKIAALGLRVRHGRSYHGLALNVDMDLAPFTYIDPCGYAGLETIDLKHAGVAMDVDTAGRHLLPHLLDQLQYVRTLDAANDLPESTHG